MKKVLVLVCMVLLLSACGNSNETNSKVDVLVDANQFARITSEELVALMGEPESIEDYEWSVPKTGESIVGKLYIYQKNKFEFVIFENSVARLNVYSGKYWGYDDSVIEFQSKEDIFSMFNIEPNNNLKKIEDTNYALRFSPVSDTVADVWIQDIKENTLGVAKITYNLNYF
ncbi:hypothetical protein [Psychrobacillus sp. BM2]|uniref:hypothetical protein n=1 Tax=Psychrobacillus sp. BM2 TaxID=3400421 RepID=UPI003B023DC9